MQYDENAEKYGYEGEMTPMKCDELEAYGMDDPAIGEEYEMYKVAEVDAAIAELKAENERLKKKMDDYHLMSDIRRAKIKELKRALWLERARRANEALLKWNLFPNFETTNKLFTIDEYDETPGATDGQVLRTCEEWAMVWQNVERKCRAKAEEYK